MAGNGIAGLAVSLLRVMTKLIIPGESHHANEMSAILYFSLSAAVIVACILAYVFVLEVRRRRGDREMCGGAAGIATADLAFARTRHPRTCHGYPPLAALAGDQVLPGQDPRGA